MNDLRKRDGNEEIIVIATLDTYLEIHCVSKWAEDLFDRIGHRLIQALDTRNADQREQIIGDPGIRIIGMYTTLPTATLLHHVSREENP